VIAFATRFADYVWAKNTVLEVYAPCDTTTESCFISDEENAWLDFQLEPYKKIQIVERDAPFCLEEHNCTEFSCAGIENCHEELCDESTIEEGEFCFDGVTNPQEELDIQ
jgi:hypothetical protein